MSIIHELDNILKNICVGGRQGMGFGGTDTCECPKCGFTVKHERGIPCADMECPKCGTQLVGSHMMETEETPEHFRYRILPVKEYPTYRYDWFSQDKGIQVLYGIQDGKSNVATVIFKKDKGWTKAKVEEWLKKNGYKFEPLR